MMENRITMGREGEIRKGYIQYGSVMEAGAWITERKGHGKGQGQEQG